MAKNPEKVMEFVRQQLASNPKVTTSELYERAKDVDPGVSKLSLRQFNARFPLQVKRRKSQSARKPRKSTPAGRRRRKASPSAAAKRSNGDAPRKVRDAFLRFAEELTRAEERQDLVKVLAGVDGYVDEVLSATGG